MTPDDIKTIRTVITHAECADGILSALILLDALGIDPSAVRFVEYNTPAHRDLVAEPGMLFCDMTPPRARVAEFIEAGAWCLDHHANQRDIVEAFGPRGVFADEPGVSGAVLAFREVWMLATAPRAPTSRSHVEWLARMVGIRDTWQRAHGHFGRASEVTAALKFHGFDRLRGRGWGVVERDMDIGRTLLEKSRERAVKLLAGAHRAEVLGLRLIAFEGDKSDASEVADLVGGEADLVMAWSYFCEGGTWRCKVSTRSRVLNAGLLGKHYAGGGHVGAGGFTVDVSRHDGTPFQMMERLVRHYLFAGASRSDPMLAELLGKRAAPARSVEVESR